MVSIYTIAGIALALFYIGYSIGFVRGDDEEPNLQGVVAVLIGGVFSAITWGAAVESIRAPAAGVVVLMLMAVFGGLLVFGLGRLFGSLVLIGFDEGPRRRTAVLLTMGLPAALAGWILFSVTSTEAALQAKNAVAREALQAGTYNARFGVFDIAVPGAPVLSLVHSCDSRQNRCTTMFWDSVGWNNRAEGPLELFVFDVVTHPDVLGAQAEWCARRPDVSAESVWCSLTEQDGMRFKPASNLRGREAERDTRCLATTTGQIGCAVTHDVAPGVAALLAGFAGDEITARTILRGKRDRAEALWASMTTTSQP